MTGEDDVERLRALVAAIPDPVYRVRADGTFVSVEVPDDHPTAVDQSTIPGQRVQDVMPRRQAAVVMAGIVEALRSGGLVAVEYGLVVDGEDRHWEARLVPAGGDVYAIVREVTDLRRREAAAIDAARTDALTGLPTRGVLVERVGGLLDLPMGDAPPLAVLFCDLDGFKAVNDGFGHPTGDRVLAAAAARIVHVVRDTDLVVRVGGDEIAVALVGVDHDVVARVAERLVAEVSAPYVVDGHEHRIGLSIGVAVHPDDAADVDGLMAAADAAMYRVKQRGGGGIAWATGR
ncbi:sensor domain-containing diguanylate cyclase [Actinomarinicola tropica]|uniref:Diguanylate cyclase n=1 Tax=Actinomarinicola tropica TaxID=2789776 RepID=A0A5Q2RP06_9ACTN|nr:sensor domain-containing diguanylate cyclase [Actinomarinicola tropica]QGG95620.1 diguanylate cyclase [Actinomarinicola tropica]